MQLGRKGEDMEIGKEAWRCSVAWRSGGTGGPTFMCGG